VKFSLRTSTAASRESVFTKDRPTTVPILDRYGRRREQLATGTFQNETASGWQLMMFSAPVPIVANTTYVASYHNRRWLLRF
jgi:hypothetical protein